MVSVAQVQTVRPVGFRMVASLLARTLRNNFMGDAGFEVSLEGWVLSPLTGIDVALGTIRGEGSPRG